jgi:hypothetical protein
MKQFIKSLFSDENGVISMKRLCGLMCTVALCVTLYVHSLGQAHNAPSSILIESVALLAFGCLGLATADKIFGKKKDEEPKQ